MQTQAQAADAVAQDPTEWQLTPQQVLFMLKHNNPIETAYEEARNGNMEAFHTILDTLTATQDYQEAFGSMAWDEAYDRYECFLKETREAQLASSS